MDWIIYLPVCKRDSWDTSHHLPMESSQTPTEFLKESLRAEMRTTVYHLMARQIKMMWQIHPSLLMYHLPMNGCGKRTKGHRDKLIDWNWRIYVHQRPNFIFNHCHHHHHCVRMWIAKIYSLYCSLLTIYSYCNYIFISMKSIPKASYMFIAALMFN